MISKLVVKSFKTLEDVEVNLGHVNVFIGANGSGKSNLFEASAANGKVNDPSSFSVAFGQSSYLNAYRFS